MQFYVFGGKDNYNLFSFLQNLPDTLQVEEIYLDIYYLFLFFYLDNMLFLLSPCLLAIKLFFNDNTYLIV